jgi:hypothetical protein
MLKHRYITCIYSAIIYQLSTNSLQISCLKYDHGLTDNRRNSKCPRTNGIPPRLHRHHPRDRENFKNVYQRQSFCLYRPTWTFSVLKSVESDIIHLAVHYVRQIRSGGAIKR